MNSLNPVIRVREQIVDAMRDHGEKLSKQAANARVASLLDQVGLKPEIAERFPHELSGGMKQRVCIAIAICLRPKVILADEPTSALDVVVQRQVMDTLGRVQEQLGASVVLVGHDMGLMAQFADRLGVMYAGRLAEVSPVREIFADPLHPYTKLLIASLPSIEEKGKLNGIPGLPPSLLNPPAGCSFHPRCPFAMPRCAVEDPRLQQVRPNRWVACHLFDPDQPRPAELAQVNGSTSAPTAHGVTEPAAPTGTAGTPGSGGTPGTAGPTGTSGPTGA
jgi:peptide/nickel transport system ATP-binding protein